MTNEPSNMLIELIRTPTPIIAKWSGTPEGWAAIHLAGADDEDETKWTPELRLTIWTGRCINQRILHVGQMPLINREIPNRDRAADVLRAWLYACIRVLPYAPEDCQPDHFFRDAWFDQIMRHKKTDFSSTQAAWLSKSRLGQLLPQDK